MLQPIANPVPNINHGIGNQETVKILVAGEFAEFKRLALEVINESR